jgi:GR25 family glycosyltransferase involved in LPS biosynthesis
VVSSRHELPGHRKRLAFLRFLQTRGVAFDLYGYRNDAGLASYVGPLPPHQKDDGILPYRYTFNAENHAVPNYCTEKLGDALLGECLCFYWGCPNIHEHLDPEAYVVLDLDDFEASYRRMLAAIQNDEWSQRLAAIRREKHRILDELQFFPTLERAIREHERATGGLGGDLALEHEVPYLIRRYRLTAGRQAGAAPAAADYLERLWPSPDDLPSARTLLLVTDASRPPADDELTDRCVVSAPPLNAPRPTPLAAAPAGGSTSYRCGGGHVALPREWLTIEDEVPVKVLNLDRRPDRWARMVGVLREAGLRRYQRVAARDGRALRAADAELGLFRANHFGWRRGVVGCALSHIGLWRGLAASPDAGVAWLILEDDVGLGSDFLVQWSRRVDEVGQVDPGWDLLFLGLTVWEPEVTAVASGPMPPVPNVLPRVERLTRPPRRAAGTHAYVLRRAGAWKLLEWLAQEGMRVPVDIFILMHLSGLSAFIVSPDLVVTRGAVLGRGVDSDIQHDPTPVDGAPS